MPTKAKSSRKASTKKSEGKPKDKLIPKLTIFFFNKPRFTAILWLTITIFGLASYTHFLKREGFPSVNIPIAVVGGTYLANDPAAIDSQLAQPIAKAALARPDVKDVQTESSANFFTTTIQFKEGTDAAAAAKDLESTVNSSGQLPESAQVQYNVPYFGATGGDTEKIDLAISFYRSDDSASTADLVAKANEAAAWLNAKHIDQVTNVFVKDPFETVSDPSSGQAVTIQKNFDRYGLRQDEQNLFHGSVIIAVTGVDQADVIKLHDGFEKALDEMQADPQFSGYKTAISASFAPQIKENISELQRVLLEGLLAVLIVGSIVIAIRASLITVISMVTVLLASLGFMYLIGYTLNVITLFALILSLALIVDDTIIMVEAIDASRAKAKDKQQAVKDATTKISRAMVAATLTAALSFTPLLFVGGILGDFIQAIPITIIAALIISLLVALIFIPFFARNLLLSKKQMGKAAKKETAAGVEAKVAAFIAKPMLWAKGSSAKLFGVGITALIIGLGFIGGGIFIARNVVFNIFPPTKDTNGLYVALSFPPGTTVEQAEKIAADADKVTGDTIGENFIQASYYSTGSAQSASVSVELVPYSKRDIKSPEIVDKLQQRFNSDFSEARAFVAQADIGPPSSSFVVQINAEDDRQAAYSAANDLAKFMESTELKRVNGTTAKFTNVTVSSPDQYIRVGGDLVVQVSASFDADDTSTLVNLGKDAINKEFTPEKVQSYGLSADALTYNLGQEEDNQNSFNTLLIAFPILLAAIFVLLAVQFRSLLQPLLIFMAIPFSLFGIMLGLDITHNAISFFTMLGFFALLGLSIKNTILLTDYANQARARGMSVIDSAVEALEERFRPLFATSMTAVVSLIPLAISSPFWQGLAVVLIFGLLSSTFLVITVFPYYYLGGEYLRIHYKRSHVVLWVIGLAALVAAASRLRSSSVSSVITAYLLATLIYLITKKLYKFLLVRLAN